MWMNRSANGCAADLSAATATDVDETAAQSEWSVIAPAAVAYQAAGGAGPAAPTPAR